MEFARPTVMSNPAPGTILQFSDLPFGDFCRRSPAGEVLVGKIASAIFPYTPTCVSAIWGARERMLSAMAQTCAGGDGDAPVGCLGRLVKVSAGKYASGAGLGERLR